MKGHDKSNSSVGSEAKCTTMAVNSESTFTIRNLVEIVESDKIMDREKR